MKRLLLLIWIGWPLLATQLMDSNVRDASGRKITSGSIKACPPSAGTSGSYWVSKDCITISIRNGVVNINLIPGPYLVHWATPAADDQSWIIPTSSSPVTIPQVTVVGSFSTVYAGNLANGTWCATVVSGKVVGTLAACPSWGVGTFTWGGGSQ